MNLAVLFASEDPSQSHHWLFPEQSELIYGTIASLLIFFALWKFGWPPAKKALAARTERIQNELDNASKAKADAETESVRIRQALGDIESERARLLAEADQQAAALLADGRTRLEQEAAELDARAEADIAALASRSADELRAEIARYSSTAAETVVVRSLDEATHQELIESFITRVGAGDQP